MNNAFLKSYRVLHDIYANRAFSAIALNRELSDCKKSDRALITKIVYGVPDNDIRLEHILSAYVHKMPKDDVLLFLKMGIYCLDSLSLPVYTVVNDIAELSKLSGDIRTVGFVNATLKNISRHIADFDNYPTEPIARLSVVYSYPEWAVRKLVKDYGMDVAEQIVSFRSDTRTTARFVEKCTAQDISARYGVEAEAAPLDGAFYIKGALPQDDSCTVQSLSSMAIARVCARLTGERGSFLDCCAAPGGKSVYVKQLLPDTSVTACDIHPHRVALIDSYAERMHVDVRTLCRDMTEPCEQWQEKFDTVLCDVPCSGYGVVDSRPDIKLFRENKDISELMKKQYAILDNCARFVKPGGALVYSTCTVFDNENGQNVRKFLKQHPEYTYGELPLREVPQADGKGCYQFLPYKDGMQGFFVAVLRRIR